MRKRGAQALFDTWFDSWHSSVLRFLGRPRRRSLQEPLYFGRLKHLGDAQWRAALSESPEQAARWVYAAATYGDIDAQLTWGQMLLDGHGTRRDDDAAFRWFGIAAKSKRADAVNMLGRCHECGWGVPVDFAQAAALYREAAGQSYDWAEFNLACLMLDGKGVPQDRDGAFALFTKAAAQGHVKSLSMIARFHEHGWGRPRDMATAAEFYRRGAEGGDFRGQYRYGQLLLQRGLLDDALPWLRRAVDSAPIELCREFADELLHRPEPHLQEVGALAQARIGAQPAAAGPLLPVQQCRSGERAVARGDQAPDHQHDDRADHGADETGAFAGLVPAERLPEIGRDEGPDDAEDGGEDEARRLVRAGMQQLCNDAGEKADHDQPNDAHPSLPL